MEAKKTNYENGNVKIEVTRYPIEISEIRVSDFQKKGTKTAILKQKVETKSFYPSAQVSNEFQDNLFTTEDFGFEDKVFTNTRTNVVFLDIPEDTTSKQLQARLDKFPEATLYRVLSNRPILTSNQEYAIKEGLRTLDDFAHSQVIRDGETQSLILDNNGNIQYRVTFFSLLDKQDVDGRNGDVYMSEELEAEYNAALLVNA